MKKEKCKTQNNIFLPIAHCLLLIILAACGKNIPAPHTPFASFRDVPGVTAEEIADIEALRTKYSHFVYGVDHTTEAFPVYSGKENEGGEYVVGGYAVRLCVWLTELFGIPFVPRLYQNDWQNLLAEFGNGDVHFMGDLMYVEELKDTHFMTTTIAERSLTAFQIEGVDSVTEIAKSRPPRLAFPHDFILRYDFMDLAEYAYEIVFADDYAHAYRLLSNGEVDAFVAMNSSEPTMCRYGNVVSQPFSPLVFASVSLATQTRDLIPVISVVQKMLDNGGRFHLAQLYNKGHYDYVRNNLFEQLSVKELDYLRDNPVVKIAGEVDNYPLSFYNDKEGEYQGISFDILRELELITGLSFEVSKAMDMGAGFRELTAMVENNTASLIPYLRRTKEREDRFLFTEVPIIMDYPVLISKSEFPNVHFNEFSDVTVALVRGAIHSELFKRWFPNDARFREYDNLDSAFRALERGKVDMLMSGATYFRSIENYKELAGYKINVAFDHHYDITIGLNKNEAMLCAILDKALQFIDLETISGSWMSKRFDYRVKVAEARLPWFIGVTSLSLVMFAMVLVLFYRKRNEEKRLAKLVKEETATISAILEATPDHLFCKDINRRFTRCNEKFADYHKIRSADIIGKTEEDVFGEPSELTASLNAIENKVFDEKMLHIKDDKVLAPDGSVQLFETIRAPLLLDGKVIGLVGLGRDITMRKSAEEEAKKASAEAMKAYAEAESATEAKSRFIANMSHEMRTPMNVIVGLTGLMLEEENTPDNTKETLKKINTAGTTLMGLINDVLDISKVESGKVELIPVQYGVPSLLNDIITLNIIHVEEKPITLKLDIDENLPLVLFGDDIRIKQILNNLLSNAFKYTKKGSVTLSANCSHDSDGVWMSFCVSDTGIGIQKKDMSKLFSDYNQVDTSAHRGIQGTGLGLSITKKFVELMDGEISVESEYGKGTIFRVRIRQGFVTDQTIGKETAENLRAFRYKDKKQDQEKLARADLSYAKVLVVDDLPANLDVASGMLRKYKMQVDCVTSGQESVDLIAAGKPVYDAIFMDHMMPGMDGMEATAAIRALGTEYAHNIPVIALTANVVAGNEQMFLNNGFTAYLPKPFNVMSLDFIIQRWVRDKARE
jgi:PAS domain S-box-containing protein